MEYYIMIASILASEGIRTDEEVRPGSLGLGRGTTGHSKPTKTMGEPPGFRKKDLSKRCAAKANAAKAKGASAGEAQVIYNKCMRAGGDSGDDPSGRAKRAIG